jgi:hypothetical protein
LLGYVLFLGGIGTYFTFKTQRNKKLQLKVIITLMILITIPLSIWFIVIVRLDLIESIIIVGLFIGVGILTMAPHLIDIYSTLKKEKNK